MRTFFILLFLTCILSASRCQNLVPNPSFEIITQCPEFAGDIFLAEPWISANISPDLFNSCFTGAADGLGVPENGFGFQNAMDGEGYAGILTYTQFTKTGDQREFLSVPLICPLIVGHTYNVRFYV